MASNYFYIFSTVLGNIVQENEGGGQNLLIQSLKLLSILLTERRVKIFGYCRFQQNLARRKCCHKSTRTLHRPLLEYDTFLVLLV